MEVNVFNTLDGLPDPHPSGIYVVIDAFKFGTTVCTLLANGASSVTPLQSTDACEAFQRENPDALVGGEMTGGNTPKADWDIGNSPSYVESVDVTGRVIGLHSDNGAEAVCSLDSPDDVYLASTVNAAAVAMRLRGASAPIHLLAAGRCGRTAIEDIVTAALVHRYLHTSSMDSTERRLYDTLLSLAARNETEFGCMAEDEDFDRLYRYNSVDVIPELVNGKFVDVSPGAEG